MYVCIYIYIYIYNDHMVIRFARPFKYYEYIQLAYNYMQL